MRGLFYSFRYALDGLAHALLTQRNMRIHFAAAFVVMLLCSLIRVDTFETLAALFSITLVIALELVNTAVENVVDLMTDQHSHGAKVAKDVAAAAVLIAAANALTVAYLIFYDKFDPVRWRSPASLVRPPYPGVLFVGVICLIVAISAHALRLRQSGRGRARRDGPYRNAKGAGPDG